LEPEARYTLVGALLLTLIVAAAMASVWLSRSGVASEFRYYTIHFERQSLEGLQVGGDVNMQGIKVGRVEEFSIERGNINRVNVQIRVARRTPVSTNTLAVISRNLVTGIARVNLETPGTPGPELEEIPEGEQYPVIAEGTSDFEQITRTANSLVITAEASLKKLDSLLDEGNRQAFSEMLAGVRDLAVGLHKRLDTIDRTANTLGVTAEALTDAARSFRKSSDTIAGVIERAGDQVGPLAQEAGATLQETRTTMREVQTAVRDLASATRTLERDVGALARRSEDAADVGILEARATAQQLRVGVELLTRALDRLQDPRAALLGPGEQNLGPGERIK
jgi:phospholipid/cholesterol/gamma-HCH transport system substrate-binding protein